MIFGQKRTTRQDSYENKRGFVTKSEHTARCLRSRGGLAQVSGSLLHVSQNQRDMRHPIFIWVVNEDLLITPLVGELSSPECPCR